MTKVELDAMYSKYNLPHHSPYEFDEQVKKMGGEFIVCEAQTQDAVSQFTDLLTKHGFAVFDHPDSDGSDFSLIIFPPTVARTTEA